MNAHRLGSRRDDRRGFTLIELMIVVVITGVLAALAIPTFSGFIMRSRTSEATQFLGVIKLKQESYRAEFGNYLQYEDGLDDPDDLAADKFVPDYINDISGGQAISFPTDSSADPFVELGARPDGPVRFGYSWAAGLPSAVSGNIDDDPYNLTPADHYFIVQARADLDDDGTPCTFEVTSFTRGVWFDPPRGWE